MTASYSGLHLMANLHGVAAKPALMNNVEACRQFCLEAIGAAQLTIVGDFFHGFGEGGGVTGVVVLAESHVALHTWPESNYVTLDVFVCNYHQDNANNARALFEVLIQAFEANEVRRFEVERD